MYYIIYMYICINIYFNNSIHSIVYYAKNNKLCLKVFLVPMIYFVYFKNKNS